ncbi:MAG: cupin domain-containing protein [Dehalococcoidia bacterium]|nr:cupin domain-containing protein [Dehalococcoidia bacterium]
MTQDFKRASPDEQRQTIITYKNVPLVELARGANSHIVAGRNMTLSFAHLEAKSYFPVHVHATIEQLMLVLSGELDAILDGKMYRMKPGDIIFFPAGREHGSQALDVDCDIVDIFSPARAEYEDKLKAVLARKA